MRLILQVTYRNSYPNYARFGVFEHKGKFIQMRKGMDTPWMPEILLRTTTYKEAKAILLRRVETYHKGRWGRWSADVPLMRMIKKRKRIRR